MPQTIIHKFDLCTLRVAIRCVVFLPVQASNAAADPQMSHEDASTATQQRHAAAYPYISRIMAGEAKKKDAADEASEAAAVAVVDAHNALEARSAAGIAANGSDEAAAAVARATAIEARK